MDSQGHESKIDVRIIVGGLDIAQLVSKAVNNIQLENDYNIVVSSIIPTLDLDIVKKVAKGADILLIGGASVRFLRRNELPKQRSGIPCARRD